MFVHFEWWLRMEKRSVNVWKLQYEKYRVYFHFQHTFVYQITFSFCPVIYRPILSTFPAVGCAIQDIKRRKGQSYNCSGVLFIGVLRRKSLLTNQRGPEDFTAFLQMLQHWIHRQYESDSDCVSVFVSLYYEHQPPQTSCLCEWEHDMNGCTTILQKVPWWPVHRQHYRSQTTLCESKNHF